MNLDFYFKQLESSGKAIRALAQGLSFEQAHWKPDLESWSLLEVINHLCDEEREDFRAHLAGVLENPIWPWTSIDPQQWVIERGYNERDLDLSVADFLAERTASLVWLSGLSHPDWQAAYEMPWGKLTAGDLLASWAAHDLLHLRQMVELRYACLYQAAQPDRLSYAGEW